MADFEKSELGEMKLEMANMELSLEDAMQQVQYKEEQAVELDREVTMLKEVIEHLSEEELTLEVKVDLNSVDPPICVSSK